MAAHCSTLPLCPSSATHRCPQPVSRQPAARLSSSLKFPVPTKRNWRGRACDKVPRTTTGASAASADMQGFMPEEHMPFSLTWGAAADPCMALACFAAVPCYQISQGAEEGAGTDSKLLGAQQNITPAASHGGGDGIGRVYRGFGGSDGSGSGHGPASATLHSPFLLLVAAATWLFPGTNVACGFRPCFSKTNSSRNPALAVLT